MDIMLKNNSIEAIFESENGKLTSLRNAATGWEILCDPEKAESFEMLVPITHRQCNPVYGGRQKLTSYHKNGDTVTFVWDGVESELTGRLDIKFTATATLTHSGIEFTGKVENHSPYTVEDVKYPFIGELARPKGNTRIQQMHWTYGGMKVEELYPKFDLTRGYWGRVYPLQQVNAPQSNFTLFCAEREGIYFGCHDTKVNKMVVFCYEARPAVAGSLVCNLENQSDKDVYSPWLNFFTTHLLYTAPGRSEEISPIVVAPFAGSWHKGMDIYKEWRKTWYKAPPVPKWATEPHAWYEIQLCNYGEAFRFPYKDLVKAGEECVKHGIKALQLVGWTREGQDGCMPDHTVEPRLGTYEEFKEAIATVQEMGVKVVLYTKYLFADTRTEWFRKELQKYASRDKYGDIHSYEGYYYENISNLSGINTHRLAMMCFGSEEYREICKKQMKYCLDTGALGIIYDEPQHHREMPYCFDESHGHDCPSYNFATDQLIGKDLRELCEAENNDELLFLCEDGWDLQHQYYGFSYFRIGTHNLKNKGQHYIPVQRYVDPYFPIMNCVWGHNDRDAVNMNIMLRFISSYEPYQFKGKLADMPLTLSYGKIADAMREKYRSYLWDGEFRDTQGAKVTDNGTVHYPYAVYNRQDGKQAVVLVNLGDIELSLKVLLDKGVDTFFAATPEEPGKIRVKDMVTLKPRGLMVLMED